MDKNFFDDIIVVDYDLVDISSGTAVDASDKKSGSGKSPKNPKNSNKKKIAIISSVAAAVVVALGVTGFCLFQSGIFTPQDKNTEFVFAEDTVISGISVGGKTVEQAKLMLQSAADSFIDPVNLSIDVAGEITTFTQDDFEYTYNIDEVLETAKNDSLVSEETNTDNSETERVYEISATPTSESIQKSSKQVEEKTNAEPENAYVSKFTPYSDNRFEYKEAKAGKKLDTADLETQIGQVLSQDVSEYRIIAKVETLDAEIKVADIKKNVKKLSSYQTVSYNTANGTSNMKLALESCNGSVIEPGATWSFNECTGDSNLESLGYKSAGVIVDGQLTDGVGGGICQASSTIYNAALRANMKVEERYNHKWASSYVPTGLDATIDYPRLDLKLSNPTDYQMFMECKLVDRTLYVSVWGYQSPDYDEIRTENEITKKSKSSYTVEAWRVYFKDGKEVDREELDSSSYDTENGYVFIEADNDSNAKNTNVDDVTEPTTQKPTEKPTEEPTEKPTQKPTQKPTTKPTEKPTQKPTQATTQAPTQPVTETQPDTTEPSETEVE